MGRDVPAITVSQQDRRRYREKVRQCLDVLARMLRDSWFETSTRQVGLEVEVNLVDDSGTASMRSPDVLDAIGDASWAPELGRFNIEVNMPPRPLCGDALDQMEAQLLASLKHADQRARDVGSRLAMVGILPSLQQADVGGHLRLPHQLLQVRLHDLAKVDAAHVLGHQAVQLQREPPEVAAPDDAAGGVPACLERLHDGGAGGQRYPGLGGERGQRHRRPGLDQLLQDRQGAVDRRGRHLVDRQGAVNRRRWDLVDRLLVHGTPFVASSGLYPACDACYRPDRLPAPPCLHAGNPGPDGFGGSGGPGSPDQENASQPYSNLIVSTEY